MKKIIALVLALTLAFASFALFASAAENAVILIGAVKNCNTNSTTTDKLSVYLKKGTTLNDGAVITLTFDSASTYFNSIAATAMSDGINVDNTTSTVKLTVNLPSEKKAEGLTASSANLLLANVVFDIKSKATGLSKVTATASDSTVKFENESKFEAYKDRLSVAYDTAAPTQNEPSDPTAYKITVVFRTAMDEKYYHGSSIGPYVIPGRFLAKVGDAVTADTALAQIKEAIRVYKALDNDDLGINDWIESQSGGAADNVFEKYKVGEDHPHYSLNDFTLNEEVVFFNGTAHYTGSKLVESESGEANMYTVFLEQVNVPEAVLTTIADELGKLSVYYDVAEANVVLINEAINGFKAFSESLVNAEWPSAEDVEVSEQTETGPNTGEGAFLGGAIIVALALTCGTVALVRKREEY